MGYSGRRVSNYNSEGMGRGRASQGRISVRYGGRRLAVGGRMACGGSDCTLRRVREYLPQSTQELSAKYAGGFRPTAPGMGQGRPAPGCPHKYVGNRKDCAAFASLGE